MLKMNEMTKGAQIGVVVAVAIVLSLGLYFGFFKQQADRNTVERQKLQARLREVQDLRKYESDMPRLNQQIATLKEQLEIQKKIVPDEKEADEFMHLLESTAQAAGIEIRRWTAKDAMARDYYTEVPFDLELDGPYYSVVNFFDRVAKLERIINVSNLQLAALKAKSNKYRRSYRYAPQESVAGICTATTFFSRDQSSMPPPPAAAGKPVKGRK